MRVTGSGAVLKLSTGVSRNWNKRIRNRNDLARRGPKNVHIARPVDKGDENV
jgi:hypothetical protein